MMIFNVIRRKAKGSIGGGVPLPPPGESSPLNSPSTTYPYIPRALPAGFSAPTTWLDTQRDAAFFAGGAATVLVVNGSGTDLQTHLNTAAAGSTKYVIIIPNGVTCSNAYSLPAGNASNWKYVMSQAEYDSASPLTSIPTRMTAALAASMNLGLISTPSTQPAIATAALAARWRFTGVKISATPQGGGVDYNYGLIRLGDNESLANLPEFIYFDRCDIAGPSNVSVNRGITMNCKSIAVIDSSVRNIYWPGTQTQAVGGWAGPGPYKIVNNLLEATGENIIFGGADPTIVNLSPSDIEIRRNHLYKPLAWLDATPSKNPLCNLLELKHAKRVLIEGNVLENSWSRCQSGMAFNYQSLSDAFNAWTITADVVTRFNKIINVNQGAYLSAHGYNGSGIRMQRVLFEHNFFDGIGGDSNCESYVLASDILNLIIRRNTMKQRSGFGGTPVALNFTGGENLTFTDNINFPSGLYGPVNGDGGIGEPALNSQFGATWIFTGNVMEITAQWANPPAGNTYVTSLTMDADGTVAAYPDKGAYIPDLTVAISGVV